MVISKKIRNPRAPRALPAFAPRDGEWAATAPELAARTGLSVEAIERTARDVTGGDVSLRRSGVLHFSAASAEKILAAVEAGMSAAPATRATTASDLPPEASTPPVLLPQSEDLRVTRVFPRSCNILALRANGLEVTLRVKSTEHLLPGMLLPGCLAEPYGWTYYGRLPRTTGERARYFP